ncbi:hypothetical protein MWU59_02370 [Flavobacteriaceae bacterium F08102]|nr:hypothetical protein [Flavobacteriaceae bacterium F08102]
MLKNSFAIFLFLVFANFIVTPTIVSMVDTSADISMVFNVNEEEHKQNELEKDEMVKLFHVASSAIFLPKVAGTLNDSFQDMYTTCSLKQLLPPPEHS